MKQQELGPTHLLTEVPHVNQDLQLPAAELGPGQESLHADPEGLDHGAHRLGLGVGRPTALEPLCLRYQGCCVVLTVLAGSREEFLLYCVVSYPMQLQLCTTSATNTEIDEHRLTLASSRKAVKLFRVCSTLSLQSSTPSASSRWRSPSTLNHSLICRGQQRETTSIQ